MNVYDLYDQYNKEQARVSAAVKAWDEAQAQRQKMGLPRLNWDQYEGPKLDYRDWESKIAAAIKEEFNLTDEQTGYIMGETYSRFHSSFGDMFCGAHEIAEFVTKYPRS